MNEHEFDVILKKKDKQIKVLENEKSELQGKVCELEKRLLMYENAHTPPSLQKKKRIPRESSGKLGAPIGHPLYEREEPEIDKIIEHKLDKCPYCDSELDNKEKLEIIEEEIPDMKKIKVRKHLIEWCVCPNCKKRVMAKNNAPSDRFGPILKSKITLLKYDDRLPLRKVQFSLDRDHGFKITHTGLIKIIRRVANKLKEPYYEVIKKVRGSKVVYIDETQYKLNGKTWWLWTFVCNDVVLFVIRKSRSKEVIEEILGKKFNGIIVCDGWSAYPNFTNTLQRCWAHLLRESHHLKENHKEFEVYQKQIVELFEELKRIRMKPPNIEERRFIIEKMKDKLLAIAFKIEKASYSKALATKIRNGINYWFTCIEYLEVEPTNNFAEQSLRELIVQRKIMGGLRSEKGAETLETISTLIATWKKQGKPLLDTMKDYLV